MRFGRGNARVSGGKRGNARRPASSISKYETRDLKGVGLLSNGWPRANQDKELVGTGDAGGAFGTLLQIEGMSS